MKKFLPFLSLAIVMVACNNNPDNISANYPSVSTAQTTSTNIDTVGFAQFQNLKAQNELVQVEEPKQAVQYVIAKPAKIASAPIKKVTKSGVTTPKKGTPTSNSGSSVSNNDGSGTSSSQNEEVAKAPVKEGWSKAAKGTAIGGAGGAIAGAVLNKKNRAVGAVIGAVIGAGGGYVVGRGQDKKDGRY